MIPHDSSFGPRLHEVETAQAVHEAVCSERYNRINESLDAIRKELADQWGKQQLMMNRMMGLILFITAAVELARKFLNW